MTAKQNRSHREETQPHPSARIGIPSYVAKLLQYLEETEETTEALRSGQVDAVVDPNSGGVLLLQEAKQALLDSERLFRAIFDGAMDAMLIADDTGRYVDANPAASTLFGLPKEALVGKHITDFAAPGYDYEGTWQQFQQKRHLTGEFLLLRPDGTVRETEYAATTDILPGRHLSVLRDMTQRKKTERALQESEARYRNLFETMDQGVIFLNQAGRITNVNPAAEHILGLSQETMQGIDPTIPGLQTIHEDGSPFPPEEYPAVVALRTGHEIHNVVMGVYNRREERYRWINLHARPQFGAGEQTPCQVYVTFEDITQLKKAEEQLRETEEIYRQAIAAAGGVPYQADRSTQSYSFMGEGIQELTGYSAEEMKTNYWPQLIQEEIFWGPLAGLSRSEILDRTPSDQVEFWTADYRIRTRDGEERWISDISIGLRDESGEPTGSIGFLQDITARKQAEIDLRDLNQQLKQRNQDLLNLHEISLELGATLGLDELYQKMYAIGQRLLDAPHFVIALFNETEAYFYCDFAIVDGERIDPAPFPPMPLGVGPTSDTIRTRKPIIVDLEEVRAQLPPSRSIRMGDERLPKSALYVPLVSGDRTIGVINVQHYAAGAFQEVDRTLLSILANQAAVAIENAGLFAQAQQEIEERRRAEAEKERTLYLLRERVKEQTLLHQSARLLHSHRASISTLLEELIHILPPGWQYPSITAARIRYNGHEATTENFRETPWRQQVSFQTNQGQTGSVEVVYLEERPTEKEGPFLAEERNALNAVAEMLGNYFNRILAEESLNQERDLLERITSTSPVAIILVDRQGEITFANTHGEKLLGVIQKQLKSRSYDTAEWHTTDFDGNPYPIDQLPFRRVISSGQPVFDVRYAIERPDETRLVLSVNGAPLRDKAGKITGVVLSMIDITARVKAEHALRESQARLAGIVESALDAIVTIDAEQRIVLFNAAAEEMFGCPAAEAMDQSITRFIPERYREFYNQRLQDFGNSNVTNRLIGEDVMLYGRRFDGTEFPIEASISQIEVSGQKLYTIILRDITQRKQRERVLAAIAHISDVLRAARTRSEMLPVVLEQLEEILPIDAAALVLRDPASGESVFEEVSGEFASAQGQRLPSGTGLSGQVIRSGQPYRTDHIEKVPFPTSHQPFSRVGHHTCVPLTTHDRTIGALWIGRTSPAVSTDEMRVLTAIADIAANAIHRSTLYEQLQAQAYQMQQLMETISDGLVLLDAQGCVQLANPAGLTYLNNLAGAGLSDPIDQLGGRPLRELLLPPPQGKSTHEIRIDTPLPALYEVASHAMHPQTEPVGWVLVIRDVTEERERQQQMMQRDQLAAVGQLSAGIAHDFNNIMSAIILYVQLLQSRLDLSERDQERFGLIQQQAEHAVNLVRQLLDFSRRSVMERSPVDLVPFCKELIKMLERILPEIIALDFTYDRNQYLINADPTRLQQALINLAVNARDAMPNGGRLSLSLAQTHVDGDGQPLPPDLSAGDWLRIEIRDTGSGIPAQVLPHIFEPFYTTKKPGKGTGLGLAQVYGIVTQHNGRIVANSQEDKGTVFTIFLPLLKDAPDEEPVCQVLETVDQPAATILVAEDNPATRRAIQESLELKGYQVLPAADGQEALALFVAQQESIDLVLSDMIMPGTGGTELYHALTEIRPDLKMIVMTGYPLEDDGKQLLRQGILSWLQKPFQIDELMRTVQEAL